MPHNLVEASIPDLWWNRMGCDLPGKDQDRQLKVQLVPQRIAKRDWNVVCL
jgi:hypothetical protein